MINRMLTDGMNEVIFSPRQHDVSNDIDGFHHPAISIADFFPPN